MAINNAKLAIEKKFLENENNEDCKIKARSSGSAHGYK